MNYKPCQGSHLFPSLLIRINLIPTGIKVKQHVFDPFLLASVLSANGSGSAWVWLVQLFRMLTGCFEEQRLGPAKRIFNNFCFIFLISMGLKRPELILSSEAAVLCPEFCFPAEKLEAAIVRFVSSIWDRNQSDSEHLTLTSICYWIL